MVGVLNELNLPIVWTAPSGMIVKQMYNKLHKANLSLTINSKRVRSVIYVKSRDGKFNLIKSKNAISPNIIHSLDATLLMSIVNEFNECMDIVTVHDCFITSPNNMKFLTEV